MSNSSTIAFPSKWDEENVGAKKFYEQCLPFAKETDDFYRMADVSIFFVIFAIIAAIYMTFASIWLFIYRKTYIFKRQCVSYYLFLLIGSLIITFDNIFVENHYETYPCIVHHLLTSVGYPTYLLSVAFIIIKYYKYYYKSQIAYFNSFLGVVEEKNTDVFNKRFIFKYFYTSTTSTSSLKFLFIINALSMIYSNIIYFVDNHVSSKGFCGAGISYLPQIMEFALFLIVFLPLALIEALKFDDKFKMKKSIVILIIANIGYFVGFLLGALVNKIKCAPFVQYAPPGLFVILSCMTCVYFFTVSMLKDILYINKCNKKLKGTYKGMIEMLEDKIQFREFGEFCIKESCVENILFLEEYWKFKKIFNKNDKLLSFVPEVSKTHSVAFEATGSMSLFHDPTRSSREMLKNQEYSDIDDIVSNSTSLEPKISDIRALYNTIEQEAFKFRNHFIGSKALYEINIQNSVVTRIINKLKIVPGDLSKSMEEKIEIYYVIFDEAYKEVINNIYLNSYSNYVHQKNKKQKEQKEQKEQKQKEENK